MNIILLSGGGGTRLWPLSDDAGGKQFLRLFRDDTGRPESMLQRVYRQMTTVDPEAKITIAAGMAQVDAIREQLGDHVRICAEPCRRDTFPAIVLAAAYLHEELHVGDDEGIVVCPVDPYVDSSFYEAAGRLEALARNGTANLALMGIEPADPDGNYGYILPENTEEVSPVREFREKPDRETAERYLAQGALWNAGVFAFRLGYLLDKAHSILAFTGYRDLYSRYETLPRISFDRAVVEREPQIQVLRYAGAWKDVGTWDRLAEVLPETAGDSVMLDGTCVNTRVVNTLPVPILCMGCSDLIVVAGKDGILIADRAQSGRIRPYVEAIRAQSDSDPVRLSGNCP